MGVVVFYVGFGETEGQRRSVSRLPTPVRRRKKVMEELRPTVITSV